jgi:hypothetical protein
MPYYSLLLPGTAPWRTSSTPPTSAGRRMRPNAAGLSNIDRMRRMIRLVTGMLEPVSPTDTGSSSDQVAAS